MFAYKYHLRSLVVSGRTTVASASGLMADADAAAVGTKPGVKRVNGTPLVSEESVVTATLLTNDRHRGSVQLRGVPDTVLDVRSDVAIIAGRTPNYAADEVLIGERLRGRFKGFEVGASFELRKGRMMKVAGVFHAGLSYDSEIWLGRSVVRTTFGREGHASSVYAVLEGPQAFAKFKSALEQDKRLGLQAFRERDYFQIQTQGRAKFIAAMGSLVGFLFGVGAMIGAMITMFAAIESRQSEVGTMRALGFPRRAILFGFLVESSAISIIAGIVGTLAASALAFSNFTMLDFSSRAEVVLDFDLTPKVIASAIGCSLIMGMAGGLLPAWRAARISVLAAIRG